MRGRFRGLAIAGVLAVCSMEASASEPGDVVSAVAERHNDMPV